jgi:cytochrome P450
MFIAASDTSTNTVQWAMAQLLRHPEKMKKAAAELAEQLGSKDFVTESDLNKLPYLHAVVKETLRLHPAVPIIPREVVEDGVSLGGFNVPKGTGVVVNLWAIGRDEKAWPSPEEFIPERFLAAGEVRSVVRHRLQAIWCWTEGVPRDGVHGAVRASAAGRDSAQDRVGAA